MDEPPAELTPRPGVGFVAPVGDGRVGIELRIAGAGHRWCTESDPLALSASAAALTQLAVRCTNKPTAHTTVGLTVVTSLAEGSDRIVAKAGLSLGARLEVILPLELDDYREDFRTAESRETFDGLLSRASLVVAPVAPAVRPDAYRVAGQAVLARSDALLALWDGLPSRGAGGTGEIVAQAREQDIPMCWLRVTPASVQRLELKVELEEMPDSVSPLSEDAFAKLDWFNRRRGPSSQAVVSTAGFPSTGEFAQQAFPTFRRADDAARRMQWLLRSVNRAVYTLAAVAVAVVAAQVIFVPTRPAIVWAEFAALSVILIGLLSARRGRFLERWLSLRYLAERIRSLAYLSPLIGLNNDYVNDVDAPVENPFQEWSRRALDELLFHTPPPPRRGGVDFPVAKKRLIEEWVRPQLKYQEDINRVARRRHKGFSIATIGLFGVSLITAFLHSTGWFGDVEPDYLGFLSLVVPAAAAAASGYAAQRDYARQAIRSGIIQDRLRAAVLRLEQAVDLSELRRIAVGVESTLQGEAADWYTAVRLHEPEVP